MKPIFRIISLILSTVMAFSAIGAVIEADADTKSNSVTLKSAKDYEEIFKKLYFPDLYPSETGLDAAAVNIESEYEIEEVEDEAVEESTSESINLPSPVSIPTSEFSQTNIQVKNVDEADIIKTDGKNIYYLTRPEKYTNGKNILYILEPDGKGGVNLLCKKSFISNSGGYLSNAQMYLQNQKIVLLFEERIVQQGQSYKLAGEKFEYDAYNNSYMTTAIIYDVKDPANPRSIKTFSQSGLLSDSRLANGKLTLFSEHYSATYEAIKQDNKKLALPIAGEGNFSLIPAKDIYYAQYDVLPTDTSHRYFTNITQIDIEGKVPRSTISILGNMDKIYHSGSSLYMTQVNRASYGLANNSSAIFKFDNTPTGLIFKNAALVPGTPYNQFALDERNGFFRIATTHSYYTEGTWNSQTLNNLYIFDENLKQVSAIEDLAPTETIHSVRYIGDMAYMVTFKQVDPLFAINLKNPHKPVLEGELKIPGFSTYLHPMGNNLMLGFGSDADERGSVKGLKLSLFDVSDSANMKELDVMTLGGIGSHSALLSNHKVLLYSKENNLFGFPVNLNFLTNKNTPSQIMGEYSELSYWNGFVICGIENQKIVVRSLIPINSFGLSRGLFIGNYIYIFFDHQMCVLDMATMKEINKYTLTQMG